MNRHPVTVSDSGDAALRVVAHSGDRERDWRLVHGLANYLDESELPGIVSLVPTYDSLLIEFEPVETSSEALAPFLIHAFADLDPDAPLTLSPRRFRIPVFYGGEELGPDLEFVASGLGIAPAQVVALHHEKEYVVRCLGAPGGSPMCDGPAFPRPVPRLASPRVSVPQGAISVAGRQATLTPAVAPGGWPLIGRTPLVVLDLSRDPLVPYAPGDLIEFYPIVRDEFDALRGEPLVSTDG